MSIEIGSAISTGVEKLTTAAGVQLAALYGVFVLFSSLGINTVVAQISPSARDQIELTLPVSAAVGAGLYLLCLVVVVLLAVVIFRSLAHDVTDLDSIPSGVTDRLAVTAALLFVANLVVGLAVFVGFVLLVVPGIFLAVSLAFTPVYVAVEGEGPFEAMSSSWSLASGNRLSLFALGLVVLVISFLVGMGASATSIVSPAAGTVVQSLISGVAFVFGNAVLIDAYGQLQTTESEEVGPLTAEDLEEDGLNQNR